MKTFLKLIVVVAAMCLSACTLFFDADPGPEPVDAAADAAADVGDGGGDAGVTEDTSADAGD